jgi:DNA-binding MltR family transcriptional regulator
MSALVFTAFLDDYLQKLLLMKMPTLSNTKARRIFEGPLESFGAKIEVAYAFELIDDDIYQDPQVIREIRNEFAHSITAVSFTSPEILKLVRKFKGWNTNVSDAFEFFRARAVSCHAQIAGKLERSVFEYAVARNPRGE